jgi:diguanylate cyclase (GGDEF)-like protein/PAS domain S-box-containing protein
MTRVSYLFDPHLRRRSAAWILASLSLLCQLPVASAQTPRYDANHPLIVVSDDNYPPYIFRDAAGTLTGYLVDYWKLWEEKTGIPVDLQASDWDKAKARMQDGKADVIDTIFQTPERQKILDFTAPYAQIPVYIYSQAAIGGISDLSHLHGFLVGVKAGDACIDTLAHAGVSSIKPYSNYETLVNAALSGEVKIFCLDEPPANYLLYKHAADDAFHRAFQISTGEFHRAVHKGDVQTLALLERGFASINDSELRSLRNQWMGTRLIDSTTSRYLVYLLCATALGGSALLLWGTTLRRRVAARTQELDAERARLRTLLEAIPDLVWLKDIQGIYRFCNPMFERFLGAAERDIVGKTDHDFVAKELADKFRQHDLRAIEAGKPSINEEWIRFADDGRAALLETTKTPVRDASGNFVGVLGVARDITERNKAEEQIRQLAFFDPLTHLPNRRLLADRLQQGRIASERTRKEGALLFIDLDHFKAINDTLGHAQGDQWLTEVALRIGHCVREGDTVARLGGDEFVVILENLSDDTLEAARQAEVVGEKILLALRQPFSLQDQAYCGSASIGVALFEVGVRSGDELMRRADLAMYQAKSGGRNRLRFYDPKMQAEVSTRIGLENDMRAGLASQQFLLHYQSQIGSQGEITGAECLIRWQHPQRGLIPPAEFISLAEDTGLIVPMGKWVIATACEQLARWARRPPFAALTLAVNVSARQFHQDDFVAHVVSEINRTGADPQHLEFELTESVLVSHVESTIEKMLALKSLGIRFSLDDFGTGFSSLMYLKRLPLDQLKIDKSFVRDLLFDKNDMSIAATVVALTHSLGLGVIAEGVETTAQRDVLHALGCHCFQGYLFSKPVEIDAFEEYFDSMDRFKVPS